MINLSIGGCSCGEYIAEDGYKISSSLVKDTQNSYTDINGKDCTPVIGRRIGIEVQLIDVPKETAAAIESAISGGSVSVAYSSPAENTLSFRCTSYTADCSDAAPNDDDDSGALWNITAEFESIDLVTAVSGQRL